MDGQGRTANRTSFTLNLTNCPAIYRDYNVGEDNKISFGKLKSRVGITFDGNGKANVDQASGHLKNTISWDAEGGAKDVGVQVLSSTGQVINLADENNAQYSNLSKGNKDHQFAFSAQFVSLANAVNTVTAGNFNSSIPFEIIYK